jgi:hypothetical protein
MRLQKQHCAKIISFCTEVELETISQLEIIGIWENKLREREQFTCLYKGPNYEEQIQSKTIL